MFGDTEIPIGNIITKLSMRAYEVNTSMSKCFEKVHQ